MTYESAAKRLGARESRKLGNNTYLQRRSPRSIAIRLHDTDVLTFQADGPTIYNSGGWQTVTTKQRMNEYGPTRIFSDKGVWYLGDAIPYIDGIMLEDDGSVSPGSPIGDARKTQRLRKQAADYAKGFIAALEAGKVSAPGLGDCFYCQMTSTENGKTLGELTDSDHVRLHLKERYYVPSLLARACKVQGVAPVAYWYLGSFWDTDASAEQRESARRAAGGIGKEQVTKALTKYVRRQLGLA